MKNDMIYDRKICFVIMGYGKKTDINEPYEVRNWCAIFGVSEDKLKRAVLAVGDSAKAVREYLGK